MEMHQVRYFLAVSRTLNFTKAAEECNVAQPSLTRAVQKLEEELGGALFHRERANTHLTELGKLMLPHLEQTYGASQAAKALATSVRKGEVAPLRLAIDTSVSVQPVIDIIASLRQSIQGIELTLGATRMGVLEETLDGAFDLVVASQSGATPDRMRSWLLFREQCQIIVPKDHRFAKLKSLSLAQLDGEQIVERIDCCLHDGFVEACRLANVKLEVRHRAASEDQLQRIVLAGFGCGVCPPTIALAEGLVGIPFVGDGLERDVVLATVAGRRFSVAADAFVKVARARDWSAKDVVAD